MPKYQMYINGSWHDPVSQEWIDTVNPYSGKVWAQIPRGNAADVDAAVSASDEAFRSSEWRDLTATQRGKLLCQFADLLALHAEELAEIEVRDNGKLYSEVINQCRYMTQWFQYYGGLADKIEGAVPPIDKPNILNLTKHEPLGVCACITPWNSPLLLLAWKAAPALAAGNTIVIKPSEYTSASSLEFARISQEANFPPGVINVITGLGSEVGDSLVRHNKVRKVAFTGGEEGGRKVSAAAAQDFKKVTLELGGKSANIVFDDANLDEAVSGAISGIFAASGQTCIAGSRLLLHDTIHDEFVERLLDVASQARIGDPMSPDTQFGPITTKPQYRKILECIEVARNEGAVCVLGGCSVPAPDGNKGLFIQPTIFSSVTNKMRIAQEEIFGPVLAVLRFSDEEQAIHIANDTKYGLAAGVWTQSLRRAINISERLEAGTVWVNTYRSTSFTTPFGGYKASGLGRENGLEAIKEYLQTKSIWLSTGGSVANPYMRR